LQDAFDLLNELGFDTKRTGSKRGGSAVSPGEEDATAAAAAVVDESSASPAEIQDFDLDGIDWDDEELGDDEVMNK
jgi:hypothetical protein